MHNQSEEVIDEYRMTVGDMSIELYQVPPFLLAELLAEFMIEATIQKNRK